MQIEHPGYRNLKKHRTVRHSTGQLLMASCIVKPSTDNFHKVSREYLPLYVATSLRLNFAKSSKQRGYIERRWGT